MSDLTGEEFYDAEIAPVLLELGKRCEERGLSFVATVEWAMGEGGTTASLQASRSLAIQMAYVAAKSNSNADSIIWHMMQHAEKHGHSSVCLKQLGVPLAPGGKVQ